MSRWDALQPRRTESTRKQKSSNGSRRSDEHGTGELSQQRTRESRGSFGRSDDATHNTNCAKRWNETVERLEQRIKEKKENLGNKNYVGSYDDEPERKNMRQDLKNFSDSIVLCSLQPSCVGPSPQSIGKVISILIESCLVTGSQSADLNSEVFAFVSRLLVKREGSVELTGLEANRCVTALYPVESSTQWIDHNSDESPRLGCLILLLPVVAKYLPAEETAHGIVQQLLVPLISDPGYSKQNCALAMEGICCLLEDNGGKHASAMLAPLVLDVALDGEENIISNPLLNIFLRALTEKLLLYQREGIDDDVLHLVNKACVAFKCVLNAIRSISISNNNCCAPLLRKEVNLNALGSFFEQSLLFPSINARLGINSLRKHSIDLIIALLNTYLDSSAFLGRLLLAQAPALPHKVRARASDSHKNSRAISTACLCCPSASLIQLIHSDSALSLNAVLCTQELVQKMPLQMLLTGKTSASLSSQRVSNKQSIYCNGQLSQQISLALRQIMQVVRCQMSCRAVQVKIFLALCGLATCILTNVPFCDDALIREAVSLLSTMGTLLEQAVSQTIYDALGESLTECMGGRMTPHGTRIAMIVPMKEWLNNKSLSTQFLNDLFRATTNRSSVKRGNYLKILGGLVRSEPSLILDNSIWWREMRAVLLFHAQSHSERMRVEGMNLLESFLLGRKDYESGKGILVCEIMSLVVLVLSGTVSDSIATIRASAMNVYGAILGIDWSELFRTSEIEGMRHLKAVLNRCVIDSQIESNSRVRSAACKAIGNICTECILLKNSNESKVVFFFSSGTIIDMCKEVGHVLTCALKDSNASVRSMALFATGNLAQVLRERNRSCLLIDRSLLHTLAYRTYDCMTDSDDKVVGNAIRTIGHVSRLLYQYPCILVKEIKSDWNGAAFYFRLIHNLADKVNAARLEATGRIEKRNWKQRSFIRKQGWGACSSLALLLDNEVAIQDEQLQSSKDAVMAVVLCLHHVGSMNEKIVLASICTLRIISPSTWFHLSSESSGIAGLALRLCIVELYKVKGESRDKLGRVHKEMYMLLKVLVEVATIFDICCVLKREEVSRSSLEFLYEWMSETGMGAFAFEGFALALQRRDISDNVALQQRFASRSLLRYREENYALQHITCASDTVTVDTDDEGLDEL